MQLNVRKKEALKEALSAGRRLLEFCNQENGRNTIDLHMQYKKHAIMFLQKRIKSLKRDEYDESGVFQLVVITGHGQNRDKEPVLKPEVKNFLDEKGYEYSLENEGCYNVKIKL